MQRLWTLKNSGCLAACVLLSCLLPVSPGLASAPSVNSNGAVLTRASAETWSGNTQMNPGGARVQTAGTMDESVDSANAAGAVIYAGQFDPLQSYGAPTGSPTPTGIDTFTPSPSPSGTPRETPTPTSTASTQPTPSRTPTFLATSTATPTGMIVFPTATSTRAPVSPTSTPTPSETAASPSATPTGTPPTATPTGTPVPSQSPTGVLTPSASSSPTPTHSAEDSRYDLDRSGLVDPADLYVLIEAMRAGSGVDYNRDQRTGMDDLFLFSRRWSTPDSSPQ